MAVAHTLSNGLRLVKGGPRYLEILRGETPLAVLKVHSRSDFSDLKNFIRPHHRALEVSLRTRNRNEMINVMRFLNQPMIYLMLRRRYRVEGYLSLTRNPVIVSKVLRFSPSMILHGGRALADMAILDEVMGESILDPRYRGRPFKVVWTNFADLETRGDMDPLSWRESLAENRSKELKLMHKWERDGIFLRPTEVLRPAHLRYVELMRGLQAQTRELRRQFPHLSPLQIANIHAAQAGIPPTALRMKKPSRKSLRK